LKNIENPRHTKVFMWRTAVDSKRAQHRAENEFVSCIYDSPRRSCANLNARKPINDSNEADFRLGFLKERNKNLPLGIEAQGPMTRAKKPKPTLIMTSPTEKLISKTFQFFKTKLEDFTHV